MKKGIFFVAAVLMLSGCGLYRKYERTAVVPDNLFGEEYPAADSSSIASMGWRELFTDPYLRTLVDSALSRNTDLATAKLHVDEAMYGLQISRLGYLPSFNFAGDGGISKWRNYSSEPVETTPEWTYTLPVTASWTIDIFGRQTNTKRQGEASLQMAKDYEMAVRTGIVAGVATQYYTLLMLDEQLAIAYGTADKFEQSVRVLRAMKDAGMSNEIAVAQMEGAMYEVKSAIKDLSQSIRQVENSLCLLLCDTPHHIERGDLASASSGFPEELLTGLPADILENRPDVRAAEMNLASAYYQVNISKASMLPELTLSGTAGWTNTLGTAVINPGGLLLAATGSLFQPIFNAGALSRQVKIDKARMEEAGLAYCQAVLNAGAEVNNALAAYQFSHERLLARTAQVESLSSAVDKTEKMMKYSSGTYLEVLTAQQSLLSARTGVAQEQYNLIAAVISLYNALGGGQE